MQSTTPAEGRRLETSSRRRFWPVATFSGAYLLLAALGATLRGNSEFLFYIVVLLLLIGMIAWVDRRVRFSSGVLWGLSFWGLAHMAGGLVIVPESWPVNDSSRVLYTFWLIPERLKYDHVVHAFGFGVTTWVCWQGLSATFPENARPRPTIGLLALSALASLGLGALNEVVEFAATLLMPETNVGGYVNTGWDLVANMVGVTVAAFLIRLREWGRPRTFRRPCQ